MEMKHPAVEAYMNCPGKYDWLMPLLEAVYRGDATTVTMLTRCCLTDTVLAEHEEHIMEKCTLLRVAQICNGHSPNLPLAVMLKEFKMSETEIKHWLVLAMAHKLIRCNIDLPKGVIQVTWVNPDVLVCD